MSTGETTASDDPRNTEALRIGERVRMLGRMERQYGKRGTIVAIDNDHDRFPVHVDIDGRGPYWMAYDEVRRIAAAPAWGAARKEER